MPRPLLNAQPFTVDETVLRVKRVLEFDPVLANVAVEGELTEFKRHTSGHIYFTLAGQNSLLSCVMFRSDAVGVLLWPQVGDKTVVLGRISVYPQRGTVQLYARKMMPLGVSAAARMKEELRLKLNAEGLFAPERKRLLPPYPQKVICVTSPTGAAVQDVRNVYMKRFPSAELLIVPCLVQGVQAPESICAALRQASLIQDADIIMLVRGGGGRDDLNPFDDESVVREVARSRVPIICGVGHEIDWTLCDLAADLRAPTPSAAAELAFPDRVELTLRLNQIDRLMKNTAGKSIELLKSRLQACSQNLFKICHGAFADAEMTLDRSDDLLRKSVQGAVDWHRSRLDGTARALQALSPSALAARGYSVCTSNGTVVTSVRLLQPGIGASIQFIDGDANCTISDCTLRG